MNTMHLFCLLFIVGVKKEKTKWPTWETIIKRQRLTWRMNCGIEFSLPQLLTRKDLWLILESRVDILFGIETNWRIVLPVPNGFDAVGFSRSCLWLGGNTSGSIGCGSGAQWSQGRWGFWNMTGVKQRCNEGISRS